MTRRKQLGIRFDEYFPQKTWWTKEAKDSDVAVFTKASIRRNLANVVFAPRQTKDSFSQSDSVIRDAFSKIKGAADFEVANVLSLEALNFETLSEWGIMGQAPQNVAEGFSSLIITKDYSTSCRTNDFDHLVIRTFCGGLDFDTVFETAKNYDDMLQQYVQFAGSNDFGYLTSCIADSGSALHFHVYLFLPVSQIFHQTDNLFRDLQKKDVFFEPLIATRSFLFNSKIGSGGYFHLRNNHSSAGSELDTITNMKLVTKELVQKERLFRQEALARRRILFCDIIQKATALIENSLFLSYPDMLDILAAVQLGSSFELLPKVDDAKIRTLHFNLSNNILKSIAEKSNFDFPKGIDESQKPYYLRALILRQELACVI